MCSDVIIQKIDDTILYCKCVDCNGSCKYIENCIIKYIANCISFFDYRYLLLFFFFYKLNFPTDICKYPFCNHCISKRRKKLYK